MVRVPPVAHYGTGARRLSRVRHLRYF